MQCDCCGEKDATVHLTQVIDEKVLKVHLCESCAQQSGIDLSSAMPLADMLFETEAESHLDKTSGLKSCPVCHMRLEDFKKSSRLGCATCYETFEQALIPSLAAMHKGTRHIGKVPGAEWAEEELEIMRKRLDNAIASQNFEEAATIRDSIRVVKEGDKTGESTKRKRQ